MANKGNKALLVMRSILPLANFKIRYIKQTIIENEYNIKRATSNFIDQRKIKELMLSVVYVSLP